MNCRRATRSSTPEEIAAERDHACAAGDPDRTAALDAEHEQIADQLSRSARSAAFDEYRRESAEGGRQGALRSEELARILGIDPKTLRSRLKELSIEVRER